MSTIGGDMKACFGGCLEDGQFKIILAIVFITRYNKKYGTVRLIAAFSAVNKTKTAPEGGYETGSGL